MRHIATHLALRGHDVCVATVWHQGLPAREIDEGVLVRRVKGWTTQIPYFYGDPDHRRFHPPFPDPGFAWKLREIVNEFKPQVLHACGWSAYSCAYTVLRDRIPLIVSARDYGYICAIRVLLHKNNICTGPSLSKCIQCASSQYGFLKGFSSVLGVFSGRKILSKTVVKIHSVSTYMQTVMLRDLHFGQPNHRMVHEISNVFCVIPDILAEDEATLYNPDTRFEENSKLKITYSEKLSGELDDKDGFSKENQFPNEPFILFVGALHKPKGIYQLLEAYQKLISPPPMVIIGTSHPSSPKIYPPGVSAFFNQSHQFVMKAWEKCLIGVVPSIWPDSFPNVIMEAMRKGKAVIATDVGGSTDMITQGINGVLIPPGDVEALAAAIQQLIENPELRHRLGMAAQKKVGAYAAELIIPKFEAIYSTIASKGQ